MSARLTVALGAGACLVVAALLLVFAFDVRAWGQRMTQDDVQFQARPAAAGLWRSPAVLPGDPAGWVVGVADAIEYRHALQLFTRARSQTAFSTTATAEPDRAAAVEALDVLSESGAPRSERSSAANLAGVLTVTTPLTGSTRKAVVQTLHRAAAFFRRAIAQNQANYPAKENLELVLRLEQQDSSHLSRKVHADFGYGRGRGTRAAGSGF
ncbi:MAG TPA: hypothetical protein VHD91_07240 [Gaiellaceae bacterium]|nr:hypothetical protein [Gaiellaceae bacterium]